MNITTDKYAQIKEALVVAEHMIDALSAENNQLKADLQAPTDRSLAVYGDMIDVVDRKIEQWKVSVWNFFHLDRTLFVGVIERKRRSIGTTTKSD